MAVLSVCLVIGVFCIVMLIKNEFTCKIQIGWVNDVYNNQVNGMAHLITQIFQHICPPYLIRFFGDINHLVKF